MKLETNKKKLGQAFVVLLTSASFLGLSALPSTAQQAEFPINVTVNNTGDVCDSTPSIASWNPMLFFATADLGYVDLATTNFVDFSLEPGFSGPWDECSDVESAPPGTVQAEFLPLPAELSVDYLDCSLNPCQAGDMWFQMLPINGSLAVDPDAALGDYTATLRVVWTLE